MRYLMIALLPIALLAGCGSTPQRAMDCRQVQTAFPDPDKAGRIVNDSVQVCRNSGADDWYVVSPRR